MSAVERLQAAIDKLEETRAGTAHWHAIGGASRHILLLHRTIDAQLAVLAYGATLTGNIPASIVALADAILGADDAE